MEAGNLSQPGTGQQAQKLGKTWPADPYRNPTYPRPLEANATEFNTRLDEPIIFTKYKTISLTEDA